MSDWRGGRPERNWRVDEVDPLHVGVDQVGVDPLYVRVDPLPMRVDSAHAGVDSPYFEADSPYFEGDSPYAGAGRTVGQMLGQTTGHGAGGVPGQHPAGHVTGGGPGWVTGQVVGGAPVHVTGRVIADAPGQVTGHVIESAPVAAPGSGLGQADIPQPHSPRPDGHIGGGRGGGGARGGGYGAGGGPAGARSKRRRRIVRTVFLLVAVLLVTSLGTYVWAETRLNRAVDLDKSADRPPRGKGTNYLIVGSDSRAGLSERDKKDLHTGSADGGRTDSMMLLHTGAHGTTMMSLPRDSWVTIPAFIRPETGKHYRASKNKLNAAYAWGGPDLLVRTIEHNTGLRIDNYAELGFGGFVGLVNAVGGVEMCLDRDIKDKKSGVDLRKGCHELDGAQALAFVRQRHQEAEGDLGRTKNQQKFLAALAQKAATPGTVLDPSKIYPGLSAGLDALIVDKNTDLRSLAELFQAMRKVTAGDGARLNVPISNRGFTTRAGSAVKWDTARAKKLFAELRADRPVTREAYGGTD